MIKILSLFFLFSCATITSRQYKKWNYQLQDYTKSSFINMKDSYIVMDSFNESGIPFSLKRIKKLTTQNTVFSYLSIGEAESYRPYFSKLNKNLLLAENKNWDGNFTVKFWKKKWRKIIDQYLQQIMNQGFDGVYLDIVDVFHRFKDKKHYAKRMLNLIQHISRFTKNQNHSFKIILQNGIDIIDYIDSPTSLFNVIDGIAVEAYFFSYSDKNKTAQKMSNNSEIIKLIKQYKKANKLVLSVEYNLNLEQTKKYFKLAKKLDILPLVTDYGLKGKIFTTP